MVTVSPATIQGWYYGFVVKCMSEDVRFSAKETVPWGR